MGQTFELGKLKLGRGERGMTRLPVTSLLIGAELAIPLHVIHGTKKGPVLGLLAGTHGPEPFMLRVLREVVLALDPAELAGTVLAIPVANPVAFARNKRSTPEEDIDFGNMNLNFPGTRAKPAFGGGESHSSDRSLTEWMAATIVEHFFARLEYLIDLHCNFAGGSVVESVVKISQDANKTRQSFEINRLFNIGVIHESKVQPAVTSTSYASQQGIVTGTLELGGEGLSGATQRQVIQCGAEGILNVMRYLKMIPGPVKEPGKQLYGTWLPHVRPAKAGYLITEFSPTDLFTRSPFGIPVKQGDLLGTVFDVHSFEVVDRLCAPADGILYKCRVSGPVEAGGLGYGVTAYEGARWVD